MSADALRGRVKAREPFDLIRHLARSQSDPRKAVAELVQNALDANAHSVILTRFNRKGEGCLSIRDDGDGVLPQQERREALKTIATNIGHSFKRDLTPEERRRDLLLGQYGIGLLGFWSVGRVLEIHSRVDGSPVFVLRLTEDSPSFTIEQQRGRPPEEETLTEVLIEEIHEPARRQLVTSRLAAYLGAELRGQLLKREVNVTIVDRVARGRALKRVKVEPKRVDEKDVLELFASVPVPGYDDPVSGEVCYVRKAPTPARLAVACGGAIVLDDLSQLEAFQHSPWVEGRLSGVLEFPLLQVPPGTRRGMVPDEAALAFQDALLALEPQVKQLVEEREAEERAALDVALVRQLARVFASLPHELPQYDFFRVAGSAGEKARRRERGQRLGGAEASGEAPEAGPDVDEETNREQESDEELEVFIKDMDLLPPGPLAEVVVQPRRSQILVGESRRLRARPLDGRGRLLEASLEYEWTLHGEGVVLEGQAGASAVVRAGAQAAQARVRATVWEGDLPVSGEAEVRVVTEKAERGSAAGIPEPVLKHDPFEEWRSRLSDGHWEINRGHPDYVSVANDPTRRLRYLATLFAKELVLRNFPGFPHEALLERMVEVATVLDRSLRPGHVQSARMAAKRRTGS